MYIVDKNTGKGTAVIFDSLRMVGTGLEVSISSLQLDGQIHIEPGHEALIAADTTVHEIAKGSMYIYTILTNDAAPIGDDQELEMLVSTPANSHVHVTITSSAAGDSEFQITEGITIIDEGSGMQAYNINRHYPDTGTTTSGYSVPTFIGGVDIYSVFVPGGTKQQSIGSELHSSFVLNQDEDYVITTTNRSGGNAAMSIAVEFYEHGV